MTDKSLVFDPVTCETLFEPISATIVEVHRLHRPKSLLGIALPSNTKIVNELKALVPKGELEEERELRRFCTLIVGFTSFATLVLKPPVAGGSRVPNPPTVPNPVCHSVRFTYLRECAPDVLCAAPVGAPPGTRFFAYDLPQGGVLSPDTGNVTVPASKHGAASFSVFAESPDASGAPGAPRYVQSVEVRRAQPLAQPESMAQMASKAAAGALGVSLGAVLYAVSYWIITQND